MPLFFRLVFFFFSLSVSAQPFPTDYFRAPLGIELVLSGTFGELRNNHFHSGIDFKTQGQEGLPVYAAADGKVVRIKVSAYGFGNALYVAHPNGYTTVYGHLKEFNAEIAAWVKTQQYAKKSFEVDLFPPATFVFKKGDVIALSGNTGGSGGPHLHFEIRDTKTEETLNPAFFGLKIKDSRKPVINRLIATPISANANVNGLPKQRDIALISLGGGVYTANLTAAGTIGLAIGTFDQQDAATNNNGIYKIEQFVNDTLTYQFEMTRFAFDDSRYINAHMDYARVKNQKQYNHKCFVEQGNKLPAYTSLVNRGLISAKPGKTARILILITDSWGNQSQIKVTVTGTEPGAASPEPANLLQWNEPNTVKLDGIKAYLPAQTLYKNENIQLRKIGACAKCVSASYSVGDATIPAHKRFDLSIHRDQLTKTDRVVWATSAGGGLTSTWQGDWLVAHPREFGTYAVLRDTIAPSLNVLNLAKGAIVKKGQRVRLTATDGLSGITFYEATVDGHWVLLQFDAKNKLFWHDFEESLTPGNHTLSITMKDEVGNTTIWESVFSYQP
jgi:murein DD-endopeptidase MepM/ murein hydrolase activator NlpD